MDQYDKAQAKRAAVLEFLNNNPGSVLRDVTAFTRVNKYRTHMLLRCMEDIGDIERKPGGLGLNNYPCSRWFPLRKETISAAEMRASTTDNFKLRKAPGRRARAVVEPIVRPFGGL